jgi:two-component system nitrogen regulation response regulator GlnG
MVDEEEVTLETLPHEVRHLANPAGEESPPLWQDALRKWTLEALRSGSSNLAQDIFKPVEQIMIDAALEVSRGRRNKAAKLLGLGRNTLARKIALEKKKNPEETEQFEG